MTFDPKANCALTAALFIAVVGLLTIGGFFFFQYVLGYPPCPLCLDQRKAFYVAVPLAALLILGASSGASRKVLMGVEFYSFIDEGFGFSETDSSVVAENEIVAATVLWYPWRSHFFIKGGVGVAQGRFTVADSTGAPFVAQGTGVGITFGLGLDVPISRKLAFTANIGSYITGIGDLQLPGLVIDDVIPTTYLISIGLTFR